MNWDALSAISTSIGVIISALLTYLIIKQTNIQNKKQTDLEKEINKQQVTMQQRQIKVDIFPHKRELYLNLYKVLEFSDNLYSLTKSIDFGKRPYKSVYQIYEVLQKQYLGDIQIIIQSLREADYILPKHISPTVNEVSNAFDSLCGKFIEINLFSTILTDQEISSKKEQQFEDIKEYCKIINSKARFLTSIIPLELNISEADR